MSDYKICTRCIMDTSAEEITFDENGVCSFCRGYDKEAARHPSTPEAMAAELDRRVELIKEDGKSKPYDCIIGLSGGVDSSYLALLVKQKGLRPLAVHVDTGWNSEIAVKNIENIVTILGIDLYTIVIDWNEMQDLQRSFLLARLPNCDIPQDHTFMAAILKVAQEKGIRHVISGHNIATEFILPASWGYPSEDLTHLKDVHARFGKVSLKTFPTSTLFNRVILTRYAYHIQTHRFLYYVPYVKDEAKATIAKELGWRDYGGKHHESVFTRFFQTYYLPVKFGFDKRRAHLSNLIVTGQIGRDEALKLMEEKPYDEKQVEIDISYFCRKLDFPREEFMDILQGAKGTHASYNSEKNIWWYRLMRFFKGRR